MCGRFTIAIRADFAERFRVTRGIVTPLARYNVAPSQEVPVIRQEEGGENVVLMMRWGLVPSWSRGPGGGRQMINARAETLAERPAFRRLLRGQRCLVPATGFYEWKSGNGKRPFYIRRTDGETFAFAGLYDVWRGLSEAIVSFTIVTTGPNEILRSIHSRMPAMLRKEDEERWIQRVPLSRAEIGRILSPYPPVEIEAYEVSPLVNNPRNDGPELIEPVRGGEVQRDLEEG